MYLQAACDKINQITLLGANEPQMAMRLLGNCAVQALNYFVRICPPRLLASVCPAFDQAVAEARLKILTPVPHDPPRVSKHRQERADRIAQIMWKQTPLASRAAASYLSAFMAASLDRHSALHLPLRS